MIGQHSQLQDVCLGVSAAGAGRCSPGWARQRASEGCGQNEGQGKLFVRQAAAQATEKLSRQGQPEGARQGAHSGWLSGISGMSTQPCGSLSSTDLTCGGGGDSGRSGGSARSVQGSACCSHHASALHSALRGPLGLCRKTRRLCRACARPPVAGRAPADFSTKRRRQCAAPTHFAQVAERGAQPHAELGGRVALVHLVVTQDGQLLEEDLAAGTARAAWRTKAGDWRTARPCMPGQVWPSRQMSPL